MAVASENAAGIDVSVTTDPSPSGLASDVASQSSSTARPSLSADTPDRNDSANSSPNLVELVLCLVSKKRSGNEGK
jgi:hypothetical protein